MGRFPSIRSAHSSVGQGHYSGDRNVGLCPDAVGLVLRSDTASFGGDTQASETNDGVRERSQLESKVDTGLRQESFAWGGMFSTEMPKIGNRITATHEIANCLKRLDHGRRDEFLHVFFLDKEKRLRWSETITEGNVNSVNINYRTLLGLALRTNAVYLIVAHNHPSGQAQPSSKDVTSTLELRRICQKVGIELLDHLIVTTNSCFSFKAEKIL